MDEWKNSSKTYLLVKLMSDKLVKALTSMTLQLIGFFLSSIWNIRNNKIYIEHKNWKQNINWCLIISNSN
jgi:hypothetical protein